MMLKFTQKHLHEEQLTSTEVFSGKLLHVYKDIVRQNDGGQKVRELIRHPGAAAIVPILPDGRVVFVKQFRYPTGTVLYEIPAGKLDKGEEPLKCAQRELSEETGYSAAKWEYLTSIVTTPGFTDEVIHLYAAYELTASEQHPDEGEFVDVVLFTPEEIEAKILSGEIYDSKTLSALLLMKLRG